MLEIVEQVWVEERSENSFNQTLIDYIDESEIESFK